MTITVGTMGFTLNFSSCPGDFDFVEVREGKQWLKNIKKGNKDMERIEELEE